MVRIICWVGLVFLQACGSPVASDAPDEVEDAKSPFETREYNPLPGNTGQNPLGADGGEEGGNLDDTSVEAIPDANENDAGSRVNPDGESQPLADVSLDAEEEEQDTFAEDSLPPDTEPVKPANDASFVNPSFPLSLSCGVSVSVVLEVRNDGAAPWSWADGHKLGTVGDEDPFHETTREWMAENTIVPPGETYTFAFELTAPSTEGTYLSDWQMVQEDVGWFGDIAAFEIEVSCPPAPEWIFTEEMENCVLDTATFIRENSPQFFNLEEGPEDEKRAIAYDMMTTVINELRSKGLETGRCVANPGIPIPDPFHWCSDALVLGPPGEAVTIDIYQSYSDPAVPQVLITGTGSTGVVTDDLIPMP